MLFKSELSLKIKSYKFVAGQLETDDQEVIDRLLATPWVEVVETKEVKKEKEVKVEKKVK